MRTFYLNNLSSKELEVLTKRPSINLEKAFKIVKPILENVKSKGVKAALQYAKEFDGFEDDQIKVTKDEFEEAEQRLEPKLKSALEKVAKNVKKFHIKQFPKRYEIETMTGINCSREFRPIENVGLYVPGGSAVLPSTMLMLGIPAHIAGCKRVVVCSPSKNGKINDPLLYAAKISGIREFYKIGGVQAIALMAFGDPLIPKVDKIFGPGNQYVTAAKLLVSINPDGCSIDMPAGPSEVLVIADENAIPAFVAADLLSQAEHGADSQVVLISTSEENANRINGEVLHQLKTLSRKELAAKSLEKSFSLIVNNLNQAIDFSNNFAPEHLIINVKNAGEYIPFIKNAGSVFLGQYSPESAGDYASGTNHSLPTSGFAKTFGGVSVEMFMKSITFQILTKNGLKNISDAVQALAEAEGLEAHKKAVIIRMK